MEEHIEKARDRRQRRVDLRDSTKEIKGLRANYRKKCDKISDLERENADLRRKLRLSAPDECSDMVGALARMDLKEPPGLQSLWWR